MKYILFFIFLFQINTAFCQSSNRLTTQEKLNYFLSITDTLRKRTNNPGMAMALFYDNQLIYKGVFGVRDKEKQLPVDTETLFQIGSLTKAFTGVIGFKLEEQGKIDWNKKVIDYLPNFELQDKYASQHATFQELFTHKIGVDKHYNLMYGPHLQPNEILEKLKYLSFNGSFREKFLYNNFMYVVAGLIEEKVSQQSWGKLVQENIFDVLEMENSYTTMGEFESNKNNTISYSSDGNTIIPNVDIDNFAPAGSITSTIDDMTKWLEILVNKGAKGDKKILTQAQFRKSILPLTVRYPEDEVFYGIGWEINTKRRLIFHNGSTAGQRSILSFNPDKGYGLVILTNQQSNLTNALMIYASNIFQEEKLERIVDLDQFIDNTTKPLERLEKEYSITDTKILAKIKGIEGTYNHPAYGTITISKISDEIFNFRYYDFSGTIEHKKDDEFIAHLDFFLGKESMDFKVNHKGKKIRSLTVAFPHSQPLIFLKN